MKLLLTMCFKFLRLPSILNMMVFKYLNLKTGILKIETNFIKSPVFDIKCPHFEFSHYSVQNNNTLIDNKPMALTEWFNTYIFWFFTLIMCISSICFALIDIYVILNFHISFSHFLFLYIHQLNLLHLFYFDCLLQKTVILDIEHLRKQCQSFQPVIIPNYQFID